MTDSNKEQPTIDAATASPRPWKAIREIGPDEEMYSVFITDANTKPVARIWPENAADAALIVEAVNERERLRDLVRRLLPLAETTVENIRALGTARFPFLEQIKSDRLRGDINREVENADHLLREARAALGEEKP